jgi:hypothetical protein
MAIGVILNDEFTRGDTYIHPQIFYKPGGVQYNFTSADTVKFRLWDLRTNETLIEKPITDFTDGAINPSLTSEESKPLDFKKYGYEVEVTFADTVVFTIVRESTLNIRREGKDKVVE